MSTAITEAAEKTNARSGKYLTFVLGNESFGIPVLKVREIIKRVAITVVPQMPSYIKGVINLRGKIIPVMDLRLRFGVGSDNTDENNCIIVVQITNADGIAIQMGLVVDAVEEVANIAANEIEDTPDFCCQVDTAYLCGMAKIKGAVKTLLDIDRVLGNETLQKVAGAIRF